MIKKILYIVIILFASQQLMAQGKAKIKKAHKLHDGYSFSKAIEKYEGITDKTPSIIRNLAKSYFNTGDIVSAEKYSRELCLTDSATSDDIYNYASVLKMNKKYKEAETWMVKYNNMEINDSRGFVATGSKGYYKKLQKDVGQFSIKNLDINSEQEDFGPAFYKDKIVIASSREGIVPIKRKWNWNNLPFLNIYVAARKEDNTLDSLITFQRNINKKFHEGPASFSEDGNYVVFTRNNYSDKSKTGERNLELFSSKFNGKKWEKPIPVPFNSPEYSVGHPALSPDGLTMYFASNMPGGTGGVDIYVVTRNEAGTWNKPSNLGSLINTEGNEMFPFISHTGGLLFFASDGHLGLGGLDIFVTKMTDGEPIEFKNIGVPANSSRDDFSFILDKHNKSGYFASNRPGGKGDDDIYSYTLNKPFLFDKIIRGTAKDTKGNLLIETVVNLYNDKGEVIKSVTTNETGAYSFQADNNKKYALKGLKTEYDEGTNTADTHGDEEIIISNLILEKIPNLSLVCIVKDDDNNLIDSAKILMVNNTRGNSNSVMTASNGTYREPLKKVKLNDSLDYKFIVDKEGYLATVKDYKQALDREGEFIVEVVLTKIKVGSKLSDFIEIKPIYFDLNKSNIRPDAAIELDKIVKVMNEHKTMVIELGAHTDCRGSSTSNESLSDRRAKSSAKYIQGKIDNPDRIYGKGYGESSLKINCSCLGKSKMHNLSKKQHQENRRTEFKITKM